MFRALPDLASAPTLAALRQQEAAISQKEADLVARYNDRHPLVVNVRAEHNDIKRAIAAEARRLASNVNNDYELAKAREASLERTVQEVTGQTGADDKTAITLRELERTAAVNKSLFEDFLSKSKISEQQSTFEARDARVITPALRPGAPSYPKTGRIDGNRFAYLDWSSALAARWPRTSSTAGLRPHDSLKTCLELPLLASMNTYDRGRPDC